MSTTTARPMEAVLVTLAPGSPILSAELARLLAGMPPVAALQVVVVLRGASQLTTYAASLADREMRVIETPVTDCAEARRLGELFTGSEPRWFDGDGISLALVVATSARPARRRAVVEPLAALLRRLRNPGPAAAVGHRPGTTSEFTLVAPLTVGEGAE